MWCNTLSENAEPLMPMNGAVERNRWSRLDGGLISRFLYDLSCAPPIQIHKHFRVLQRLVCSIRFINPTGYPICHDKIIAAPEQLHLPGTIGSYALIATNRFDVCERRAYLT